MDENEVEAAKARTVRAFEQIAPVYDQRKAGLFAHFGRRLVHHARIKPGDRVLDVATGRGAVLLPAAQAVTVSGFVDGIDLTEAMVRETTADLGRWGITNASVQVMDAEELEFDTGTFDAVLCGFGLMFFPRLDLALSEFRRVLASGGTVGVSTFATVPLTAAIAPVMRAHDWKSQQAQPLATTSDLHPVLIRAGFQDVSIQMETFEGIYHDEDDYWSWFMTLRPGFWLRSQPPEAQAQFKEDAYAHLRANRQPDGIHESITALIAIART
jgi:ubiquinone/menaquinone biosynthesis C-methylase UbiE